jgi:hypothetical protein
MRDQVASAQHGRARHGMAWHGMGSRNSEMILTLARTSGTASLGLPSRIFMVEKNSAIAKGVCRHWSIATLAPIAMGAVGVAGNTAASRSWYLKAAGGGRSRAVAGAPVSVCHGRLATTDVRVPKSSQEGHTAGTWQAFPKPACGPVGAPVVRHGCAQERAKRQEPDAAARVVLEAARGAHTAAARTPPALGAAALAVVSEVLRYEVAQERAQHAGRGLGRQRCLFERRAVGLPHVAQRCVGDPGLRHGGSAGRQAGDGGTWATQQRSGRRHAIACLT